MPEPADAAEIYAATLKEISKGHAGPLRAPADFDARFGKRGWRGVIRFGIWQGEKFRPIDDGKRSLHNMGQETHEKIHHCPVEFAIMLAVFFAMAVPRPWPEWLQAELGTDDLADAYRGCPTSDASAPWTVLFVYNTAARKWMCTELWGHSYGFRSSVNNFNAWPELVVGFCRRFLSVLTGHYVDDFPTVDHKGGRGTAQDALHLVLELCGSSAAPAKCQKMAVRNTFLGQVNDLSGMLAESRVRLEAKEGRGEVIRAYCEEAQRTRLLSPGAASKLRGLIQYFATSVQGQVAKGGLQPLTMQSTGNSSCVSPVLHDALSYIAAMTLFAPARNVPLDGKRKQIAAWSDAEYDPCQPSLGGGVGYIVRYDGATIGAAARVPPDVIALLLPRAQQIGQLEALVPLVALMNETELFKSSDVLWGIDNTSAEASLVRGYSTKSDTAAIVVATHLVAAYLDCRIFYFHVDSASNPSDGLSRDGLNDAWTIKQSEAEGWLLYQALLPMMADNAHTLAQMPLELLTRFFCEGADNGVWKRAAL
ncbi:unnamed protein product [Polarella glacialis]|nr:unnamed protein product [Polarella glacialis]